MTHYTITLDTDPDTGELVLPFTDKMLAELGWVDGDTLVWTLNANGSVVLTKKEINDSQ